MPGAHWQTSFHGLENTRYLPAFQQQGRTAAYGEIPKGCALGHHFFILLYLTQYRVNIAIHLDTAAARNGKQITVAAFTFAKRKVKV